MSRGCADINAEDTTGGCTALTLAAEQGHHGIARTLLENGADVNKPDRRGRTALHSAVIAGNSSLVEMLGENGADLEPRIHGWTAALLAVENWFPRIADYLLQRGADANVADYHGLGVLHWAARNGGGELARLALAKGAEIIKRNGSLGEDSVVLAVEEREHVVSKLMSCKRR
jgi:ankyrin repeat protein